MGPGPGGRGGPHYWPLGPLLLLLLALPALAVVVLLALGALAATFASLGLTPLQALATVVVCFLGAGVNLPVARLRGGERTELAVVQAWGVRWLVPRRVQDHTVLAVNVGGALVPTALSGYVWWRTGVGASPLVPLAAVFLVALALARPVPGLGIALPGLVPPVVAALVALGVSAHHAGALAYIGGTLGTLLGADLAHLRSIARLGAPVVSIGGAGTFDGVFLSGLLAVLLAALVR
ncbi:DUF1614 domain-containing protein [Aciditerrimonas ferrireducens]|uniref:DUF1614 domain-containing protein n=1 Tax=Aciditerrimonas ferrireducens TaxID=667306 RepID=A0ABV6C4I4_9ACTN